MNLGAAAQGGSTRQRLFVRNRLSRNNFLIDTSAEVSAITPQPDDAFEGHSKYAVAANGSPIAVFGVRECTVDLGFRERFTWSFIVAQVKQSILGADFLSNFNLLPDLRNRRLLQLPPNSVHCETNELEEIYEIRLLKSDQQLHPWLWRFLELLPRKSDPVSPPAPTQHHIVMTGPPVFRWPRRLNPVKFEAAKAEFLRM